MIVNQIREIVLAILDVESLDNSENLIEIGLDSLKFVEMILQLEEKFHIEIPDEKLNIFNFSSINSILLIIKDLIQYE